MHTYIRKYFLNPPQNVHYPQKSVAADDGDGDAVADADADAAAAAAA